MTESSPRFKEKTGRSIVQVRVGMSDSDWAAKVLKLPAKPLHWRGRDPHSIWLGPDQWLVTSDSKSAEKLITFINRALSERLHAATDTSAALTCFELSGHASRTILTMGCGLDLDPRSFAQGHCARTKFACVPLLIVATKKDVYDLYVDRSLSLYLQKWVASAISNPLAAVS